MVKFRKRWVTFGFKQHLNSFKWNLTHIPNHLCISALLYFTCCLTLMGMGLHCTYVQIKSVAQNGTLCI